MGLIMVLFIVGYVYAYEWLYFFLIMHFFKVILHQCFR